MSKYRCTFCGKQFDSIPPDAVQVGQKINGPTHVYLFSNGAVHNLVSTKVGSKKKRKEEKV